MESQETYDLKKLQKMSISSDSFVRSEAARYLMNFTGEKVKNILIRLAGDKDGLVRVEALDSLSAFYSDDVENFLMNAVKAEIDELARSYAIMSWADVVFELRHNTPESSSFIDKIMASEKSRHCRLSCCYARYIFGDKAALDQMLQFLNDSDYHIRCSLINLLWEIEDSENKSRISEAVRKLLESEKNFAVRDIAERFLADIDNL